MRKPYILYVRHSGLKNGSVYYVAFWNRQKQRYVLRRSTKETDKGKAAEFAELLIEKWKKKPWARKLKPKIYDPRDKNGFVYFVIKTTPDAGFYFTKIGKSYGDQRPFNLSLPFETKVLLQKTENRHKSELDWMAHFADRQIRKEWFSLSAEALAFIENKTRDGGI